MSWKKSFAKNVRFNNLPTLGVFKVENEPESLGKGKFRVMLLCRDGQKAQLSTFEGTIGDIVSIPSEWIEAYEEKIGKNTYVRFRAAKVK